MHIRAVWGIMVFVFGGIYAQHYSNFTNTNPVWIRCIYNLAWHNDAILRCTGSIWILAIWNNRNDFTSA